MPILPESLVWACIWTQLAAMLVHSADARRNACAAAATSTVLTTNSAMAAGDTDADCANVNHCSNQTAPSKPAAKTGRWLISAAKHPAESTIFALLSATLITLIFAMDVFCARQIWTTDGSTLATSANTANTIWALLMFYTLTLLVQTAQYEYLYAHLRSRELSAAPSADAAPGATS